MDAQVRVIIADDHPMMRTALRQATEFTLPGVEIVETGDFGKTVAKLGEHANAIDLVLVDLNMPGMSGLIGFVALRSQYPDVPMLVVSATEDPLTVHRAINFGASGFIPKSAHASEMSAAIRAVIEGKVWLPKHLQSRRPTEPKEIGHIARRLAKLTPHQLRVLVMLREGKANKQIAYDLGVSEQTIKMHVSAVLRKLGVTSRIQAVILASKLDIDATSSGA